MKIQMIDLNDFYDKKHSYANNQGIGAVSIITPNQLVTRLNSEGFDCYSNYNVQGLGSHEESKIAIIRDIFNLPDVLDNGIGYYDPDFVELTDDYKKLLKEVVTINYTNCPGSMNAAIYLPENNRGITSDELNAIKYIGKKISEAASNLGINIAVGLVDGDNVLEEINSVENILVPHLEKYVVNDSRLLYEDINIIGGQELELSHKTI